MVRDLRFSFPHSRNGDAGFLFDGLCLSVAAGTTLVVMGASGVGKSTLGALIAGYLTPHGGTLEYSENIRGGRAIAYVDQAPLNVVFPWQTVADNIAYPLRKLGWPAAAREARVRHLLDAFLLTDLASAFPSRLSGGEQQRLALARSVSWQPRLIVVDEAFSGLDVATRPAVLEAFQTCARDVRSTVVMITHSISDALTLGDQCVILDGRPVDVVENVDLRAQRAGISGLDQILWNVCRAHL